VARKFAKIKPGIWNSAKFKSLSSDGKLLGMYLMTNSHFQMVGIYQICKHYMSKDTGLTRDQIETTLSELIEKKFCDFNEESEVVWVIDMALSQVADNPNIKQRAGVQNELVRIHIDYEYPFVKEFLELYGEKFMLPSLDELEYETDR
jgi:hypothetical protein